MILSFIGCMLIVSILVKSMKNWSDTGKRHKKHRKDIWYVIWLIEYKRTENIIVKN